MKLFSSQSADGRRLFAPWAAARPRDRHTRASLGVVDLEARPCPPVPPAPSTPVVPGVLTCALRVDLLSGQAPPLPTGVAAWPSAPSGALHTGGGWGFCTT